MSLKKALKKYNQERMNFLKVCEKETDKRKRLSAYKKYNSAHDHLLKLYEETLNEPKTAA